VVRGHLNKYYSYWSPVFHLYSLSFCYRKLKQRASNKSLCSIDLRLQHSYSLQALHHFAQEGLHTVRVTATNHWGSLTESCTVNAILPLQSVQVGSTSQLQLIVNLQRELQVGFSFFIVLLIHLAILLQRPRSEASWSDIC